MSTKYPGGFITKNYVAPTPSSASGIWTLDQQEQAQKAGIWPFGGPFNYIEDVFSTYLYTGNGTTQTITNGIDLSTKGGLVWIKSRGSAVNHALADTVRGANNRIASNTQAAQITGGVTAFNTNGFDIDNEPQVNSSSTTYASWTFREQAKFFDVVTYTGNGANRTIAHNLGSVPGCIIIKRTDAIEDWQVYHRSLANTQYMALDATFAALTGLTRWNSTTPTDTVFSLGTSTGVNASGGTYIAYIFAHNAGGFGLTGTDNVISCGSFTTDGTGAAGNITLGYEAQWILLKRTDNLGSWNIIDIMRGSSLTSYNYLQPNASTQESSSTSAGQGIFPTATGFYVGTNFPAASATYIYIAIRRGPMKVPSTGSSVFSPTTYSGNNTSKSITGVGFATDLIINKPRANTLGSGNTGVFWDRLRGFPDGTANAALVATSTADEATWASLFNMFGYINNTNSNPQDGYRVLNGSTDGRYVNYSSEAIGYISWSFKRAPSFFDEVCYTGTGSATTFTHNLGVVPELMIVKRRNTAGYWLVYSATIGATKALYLNDTSSAVTDSAYWNNTSPTSTVFTVKTDGDVNASGGTYVAYLFATCAGVSKVGSYTGTGAAQTINCGFTAGSRFVMIKRTDSSGDWYIWDSARGIIPSNDPYLLINSTAAEVTSTDYIDTTAVGFDITSTAPAAINANGGTYIFLAIA